MIAIRTHECRIPECGKGSCDAGRADAPATRDELQQALQLSGCRIDLDAALARPAVARCLELTVEVIRRSGQQTSARSCVELAPLAARLRRLAGSLDHQALRAGDNN